MNIYTYYLVETDPTGAVDLSARMIKGTVIAPSPIAARDKIMIENASRIEDWVGVKAAIGALSLS